MLRKCSACKKVKDESDFNWKYKNIRRSYHCRDCARKYIRKHYKNNLDYYLQKARNRDVKVRQICHEYLGNFLKSHPCVDCGETDILVLEFDHKVRTEKTDDVSMFIRRGFSLVRLIEEVAKCDVRCANCHRRKTTRESKSWKLKYAPVA